MSSQDSKRAADKFFRIGDVAGERNRSGGFRQLNELTCTEAGRFAKRERTPDGRNCGQISERLFHVTHPDDGGQSCTTKRPMAAVVFAESPPAQNFAGMTVARGRKSRPLRAR